MMVAWSIESVCFVLVTVRVEFVLKSDDWKDGLEITRLRPWVGMKYGAL